MIRPTLVALSLTAAIAAQGIPAIPILAPYQVPVPPSLMYPDPVQLVGFDADADLITDFAVRWADGRVAFVYAPEILSSFVEVPVLGARSFAAVRGQFAPPAANGRSGFLLIDNAGIGYVALATAGNAMVRHAMTAPSAWQGGVQLHAREVQGALWLLSLDPDLRQIRLGQLQGTTVTEVGTVVASDDVQEMLIYDPIQDGNLRIAARTRSGLQTWLSDGAVEGAFTAPTAHTQGGLTWFRDGNVRRLAWVVLSGNQWLLRICQGSTILQQQVLSAQPWAPNRFRMVALHAFPIAGSNTDALLVQQSSTANQLVVVANQSGQFQVHAAVQQTGTVANSDNCPGVCIDVDRDGWVDWATMLTVERRLQIATGLTWPCATPPQSPPPSDDPVYLPDDEMSVLFSADPNLPPYELALHMQTPPSLPGQNHVYAQAVVWRQHIVNPSSTDTSGANCSPMGAPLLHALFALSQTGGVMPQPVLPLDVGAPSGAANLWVPNDHLYVMLRVVGLDGPAGPNARVLWSTAPCMHAVVVEAASGNVELAFAEWISDPHDPPRTRIRGGGREVGVILKPRRLSPPTSTIVVPAPSQSSTVLTPSSW